MDTQHIGKAEVINCEFEYECPLDWFKLATTDDASIRHCSACNKEVYFCRDAGQLVLLRQYILHAVNLICLALQAVQQGHGEGVQLW